MMRATAARIIRQIFLAAGRAANPTQCFLGTGDTAAWPASAFDHLIAAKLIRPAPDDETIFCRGCEERCVRPIDTVDHNDGSPRLLVSTCDLFEDFGPFFHSPDALAMWQTSRHMIVEFLRRACSLTVAEEDEHQRRIRFRSVELQGIRKPMSLEFIPQPVVRMGSLDIRLEALIDWDHHRITLDQDDFQDCFRAFGVQRSDDNAHQASRTVQEENKVLTTIRNRRLQRRFNALASNHPKLNKEQLADKLCRNKEFAGMTTGRILRIVRMPPRR